MGDLCSGCLRRKQSLFSTDRVMRETEMGEKRRGKIFVFVLICD